MCLEIKMNDRGYSGNGCFVLATLHNCLVIFASNHEIVLYLTMTQRHAHQGAQEIADPPPLFCSKLLTKTFLLDESLLTNVLLLSQGLRLNSNEDLRCRIGIFCMMIYN